MDALSHAPLEPMTVSALLDNTAARFGDRPAMSFLGRRWTYADLADAVGRAAAGLQSLGVRPGDRVGLCLPNTPYYVIFYYAALKAGAVVVNYNPLYVARELHQQVVDSASTVMMVPDLAAICDKVVGLLPDSGLKQVIVCPFADALPAAKRTAFTIFKRSLLSRPGWSERVVSYRTLMTRDRPLTPVAVRQIWRCCNIPVARQDCPRAPCSVMPICP
jgi:long-chain acyl-CoA synthetase